LRPATSKETALRVVPASEAEARPSLEGIYRRFAPYVAAIVMRLDPHIPDLDDVVQDVFLGAARGLRRLRDRHAVKGWLATMSVRLVRRRLRLRRMWRWLGLSDAGQPAPLVDAGTRAFDRLVLERAYAILDDMPVDDRVAFVLHQIEGEKLEAVAAICRCSLATAKRRIARAQHAIEVGLGTDADRDQEAPP
jgi:RNA polymerase sigma-70 factor, ECF subfamily